MDEKVSLMIPSFEKYGVGRAALFGSIARGEGRADSDVDIVVSFKSPKYDLLDLAGLKLSLEDALRLPVDIVTYASLQGDEFASRVLRDEVVIYEQD